MLFWYIIIIATLYLCVCAMAGERAGGRNALRVIAGRDARRGEFSYVVRVEKLTEVTKGGVTSFHRYHRCTAVALSARASLTAAHCCFPIRQTRTMIRKSGNVSTVTTMVLRSGIDDTRPADDDRVTAVLSCQSPPSARHPLHPLMSDDVALLRTQPMSLHSYTRLRPLDPRALYGQRVTILGYGKTNASDGTMKSTLTLLMPLQVAEALWVPCTDSVYPLVCGLETCGQHMALCAGDSGGPVLHASGVAGLVVRAPTKYNCQMKTDAIRTPNIVRILPLAIYMDWIADSFMEMQTF